MKDKIEIEDLIYWASRDPKDYLERFMKAHCSELLKNKGYRENRDLGWEKCFTKKKD